MGRCGEMLLLGLVSCGGRWGSTPQTLKRALELAGVPVGPARRPVAETTPGVDEKVRAMLDHYGIAHE